MSLWADFLGVNIRYVQTPGFRRVCIVEAGRGKRESLLLMHGIGGIARPMPRTRLSLVARFTLRRCVAAGLHSETQGSLRYKEMARPCIGRNTEQSEASGEFNAVIKHFLLVGRVADSVDVRP